MQEADVMEREARAVLANQDQLTLLYWQSWAKQMAEYVVSLVTADRPPELRPDLAPPPPGWPADEPAAPKPKRRNA